MGNSALDQQRQIAQSQRQHLLQSQTKKILENFQNLHLDQQKAFKICNMSVSNIVTQLNNGTLTSQELLTALSYRTITFSKQLNLFTYLYYIEALPLALKCDQYRKESGKKNLTFKDMLEMEDVEEGIHGIEWVDGKYLSPLYGVPISVKDVYHLWGKLATIGLTKNANKEHQQSVLVQCFRNAGMIPFVQTNASQFGMAMETANFLWGRAKNPWNPQRSVSGSSGGQGGMISLRCSVLGVGSDIGGSVRSPSQYCGIFGLKPHSKRISNSYHAILSKSFQSFAKMIPNCIGPLAKSSEDLALFMSIVTNKKFYNNKQDPYQTIVPFDAAKYLNFSVNSGKKLRIGYWKGMSDLQPTTATKRALQQVLQILSKEQNIELIQIQIPNQREIIRQFIRQYLSCKGKNYRQMLNGQKNVKQYRSMFMMARLRAPGRFLLGTIAKWLMPRTYFYFFQKKPILNVMDYQVHVGEISEFRTKWIQFWRQKNLDFVIAPGAGCQAFPHEQSEKLGLVSGYTNIWNVLDMAVGALPVTRVRENEQQYTSRFRDILTYDLRTVARNSRGLPVGIQVVGLPYNEERVLGLMNYLEGKLKFYEKQGTPNDILN